MRFTKTFCLIAIVALVAHVSSVFGGAVLPTVGVGQHPLPAWVHHHDLVAAGQGLPLAAAGVIVSPFNDNLNEPTEPWHIEVELINPGPAVIPAGNLVVSVPGAFWNIPFGAVAVGAKVQAVLGLGAGELQWAEAPEVGPWVATYTNNMAVPVDVDGGVSELDTTPPHAPVLSSTPGTPPSGSVTIAFGSTAPIPTVSEWGLIVLTLLLLIAATILFARRRTAVGTA